MKKINQILFIILIPLVMFFGCKERTDLTGPEPISGQADLSRFVSIGNSLTSGFESNALYESAQKYSIGNLISQQVNTPYEQPLISDPGIGGQIKIVSLNPFITTQEPVNGGVPINLNYQGYYNNLGVPGALLFDVMNATDSTHCASYLLGNPPSPNAFFNLVLRDLGTQFAQAQALQPTMITLWIGNNDVLGFAASGGFRPAQPTDAATFGGLYNQLADGLASTGAKVVVANIPDVTTIPFFTTVGPQFVQTLQGTGVQGFYYQKHGELVASQGAITQLSDYSILFTLLSQSYLAYFGQPSGKFYRDNNVDISILIQLGILDTTKAFGADPLNPIPDALVLDSNEIQTAVNATNAFNSYIAAAVNKYASQFALVNVNALLKNIRASDASGGTDFGGINFSTTFVTGGIFSLDGIHPTAQGKAILANEFLKTINSKFNANYKLIDIANIPGSLSFAKSVPINLFARGSYLDPAAYKNVLF
jgi:lysophospholipase L1-like esterase